MEVRLVVVCGLPGSGKTTLARRLAGERDAVRLSPDDWMVSAGIDLWDEEARAALEDFQRSLAKRLLEEGRSVIVEWGTWARSERDALRADARELSVGVELHLCDAPIDILWERIRRRQMESTHGSRAATYQDLEAWVGGFESPTEEEIALFDPPLDLPSIGPAPRIVTLHHVQLAMPPGGETQAEDFYGRILGLARVAKPASLEARGGCWFEQGQVRVHLGVEPGFRPSRKAHPAFVVDDLGALRSALEENGVAVTMDELLPGLDRIYAYDPFGNRLEFLQQAGGTGRTPA